MATRKKPFQVKKEVKRLARERVGSVPPSHAMEEKKGGRKVKHKKPAGREDDPLG